MYKNIVDQMKCYERSKLTNWIHKAKLMAVAQMASNILVCIQTNCDMSKRSRIRLYNKQKIQ